MYDARVQRQFRVLVYDAMLARGLKQKALRDATGVTASTVSRWLTGKNVPKEPEIREKLAAVLGVTLRDLAHPEEWIERELLGEARRLSDDATDTGLQRARRGRERRSP